MVSLRLRTRLAKAWIRRLTAGCIAATPPTATTATGHHGMSMEPLIKPTTARPRAVIAAAK